MILETKSPRIVRSDPGAGITRQPDHNGKVAETQDGSDKPSFRFIKTGSVIELTSGFGCMLLNDKRLKELRDSIDQYLDSRVRGVS